MSCNEASAEERQTDPFASTTYQQNRMRLWSQWSRGLCPLPTLQCDRFGTKRPGARGDIGTALHLIPARKILSFPTSTSTAFGGSVSYVQRPSTSPKRSSHNLSRRFVRQYASPTSVSARVIVERVEAIAIVFQKSSHQQDENIVHLALSPQRNFFQCLDNRLCEVKRNMRIPWGFYLCARQKNQLLSNVSTIQLVLRRPNVNSKFTKIGKYASVLS